ncbi:hypothetical protein DV701_03990 [Ornithinimicrobium avium]|uniref:Nuclear transport factor 2 family protein n=1 Tax=Ornithinimicrobium avium TaxID=2283195 RepID=A0A345NK40_9MICO|nr:hypothetical protein DV701_03990 [Ornithinimicrobium avium]
MGRAGTVLAVAVAVLVVLAVVAGVLAATRPGPDLPPGSPEATVQDYLSLVHDGDLEAAAELLDPAGACTVEDLHQGYGDPGARMVLRDSRVEGDRASVRIAFVYTDGPFGADGWESDERFQLVRDGDRWVITGEPWPMYVCPSTPEEG